MLPYKSTYFLLTLLVLALSVSCVGDTRKPVNQSVLSEPPQATYVSPSTSEPITPKNTPASSTIVEDTTKQFFFPSPPSRDLYLLAETLNKYPTATLDSTIDNQTNLLVGQRERFYLSDLFNGATYRTPTILTQISKYAYWYVEDGLTVSEEELHLASDTFDTRVFPLMTEVFGSVWPPDTNNDRKISIVIANLQGLLGYYSSSNEYPDTINRFSNYRKMIVMDGTFAGLNSAEYTSILAHELQHLINWNTNHGVSTWLNEGLSGEASHIIDRSSPEYVPPIIAFNPTISLTYWPVDALDSASYYQSAFLLVHYLVDRYGEQKDVKSLLEIPGHGVKAINSYLAGIQEGLDFTDLFGQWMIANYVAGNVGNTHSYSDLTVVTQPTDYMSESLSKWLIQPQYTSRYIRLDLDSKQSVIRFSGARDTQLLPVDDLEGGHCWWSNRGDSISSSLTKQINLHGIQKATLEYRIWYEIEKDWDYGYVQISGDNGSTWDIIEGVKSVKTDPFGNSYGPGYTGSSEGWIYDHVDLTPYVGKEILVRFHYVTDGNINGTGFCIDSIHIPEIGFYDDASKDAGWNSKGFIRSNNRVPQHYIVKTISIDSYNSYVTKTMELDQNNKGMIIIQNADATEEIILVVGSLADGTHQPARYKVELSPSD